jgi:hypothetical protein
MTTLRKITAMTALTVAIIVVSQVPASSSAVAQHGAHSAGSYQVAGEDGLGGLLGGTGIVGDGIDGDG